MAKSKKIVEETEDIPARDPAQFIADERASKFLGEEVINGKVAEPEEVKEDVVEEKPTAQETPVELPREEVKEDVVEFDPEALKREAAAEARQEIFKALATDPNEIAKEKLDDYQRYQQDFFAKENRQPTWFEVAQFMEGKALEKLEAKQEAKAKEQQEQTAKLTADQQKQIQDTNKYVEQTVNELYTANKLPKIVDEKDPDDYGKRVKTELYSTIIKVNQERIAKGQPAKTIKEVFYEDFKMPEKEVAGAKAPVNMGRGGYTPDESEQIDYVRDIRGNSIRGLLNKAFRAR